MKSPFQNESFLNDFFWVCVCAHHLSEWNVRPTYQLFVQLFSHYISSFIHVSGLAVSRERRLSRSHRFLCLRVGKAMKKTFVSNASASMQQYAQRDRKHEYWFSVPQERWVGTKHSFRLFFLHFHSGVRFCVVWFPSKLYNFSWDLIHMPVEKHLDFFRPRIQTHRIDGAHRAHSHWGLMFLYLHNLLHFSETLELFIR